MASKTEKDYRSWQHPYVNIFKHVKIEEWKRSTKEGDVTTSTDKTIKCSVFRIKGLFPENSYIHIPKNSNQSLELTGRFFYLLFKPFPGKYFLVHLDVTAEEGQVVRISFSNMFKGFKSTATSLLFPFLCGAAKDSVYDRTSKSARQGLVGPAPLSVRWTCLMLDLQHILSFYLNRYYSHLRSIKLCANMTVKNVFTSDLVLDPGLSFSEAKQLGVTSVQGTGPMPRDMLFPTPRGLSWHDLYDHIKFPSTGRKLPFDSIQKEIQPTAAIAIPDQRNSGRDESFCVNFKKSIPDRDPFIHQITAPKLPPKTECTVVSFIPEVGVVSTHPRDWRSQNDCQQQESTCPDSRQLTRSPVSDINEAGIHVFVHSEDGFSIHGEESEDELISSSVPQPVSLTFGNESKQQKLFPDPILKLSQIIGFGGATTRHVLWVTAGEEVVYPCHAIIVSMKISSYQQRFFIGHTDKVSALTFNGNATLLASAQTGNNSAVRLWNYNKGNCLAMFRIHAHSLSCLSFSYGGGILCGVGKDSHNKTMVVVWNTLNVVKGGEVNVLAKAHTEVDINTMKVTFFDNTRMVSCGRDNVRLWRVRNGSLRSCPVNLGEFHSLEFTDVAFEEGNTSEKHVEDRILFASSRNGHIFEIDYCKVAVKNVRRLLPVQQKHVSRREKFTFNTGPGIAINSISVSSSFCATGSDDGFLRLWPLDFSSVLLEAEHEGPVSMVSVSENSLHVLAATSTGNLGVLNVSNRGYSTLMRSHTDTVLGYSVDGVRRHLTTASSDGSLRIWDMDSLHQLYDFVSEDSPCSVAFHPHEQTFSCGFTSGIVRVFDISTAKLLAEHKQHRGEVIGLAFCPDGKYMYSADSQTSLALYHTSMDHSVIRVECNIVARGTERAPDALAVSSDSRFLAFVGPSEYIVTITDAQSLDELLHVDVSILDIESPQLDMALKVCFSPASTKHLLIATSANKILWVCTKTGRLLRQVSNVHKHQCSSLHVNESSRFLLTAGHNTLKVWDYDTPLHANSQMFIGHSQPIRQVSFTPDQLKVISVGDAIFFWDFLAKPCEPTANTGSTLKVTHTSSQTAGPDVNGVRLSNGMMPRQTAPLPLSPPNLDVSTIGQVEQGGLGSLSICEDRQANPNVILNDSGPRPSASFLRITDMGRSMSSRSAHHMDCEEFLQNNQERPDCYKHFISRLKTSSLDKTVVPPPPEEQSIRLKAVIGYNGNGRNNMVWSPDQGLFAYSCGCVVVVEYLHSGSQRHLLGHTEEISCISVSNDAQIIVSGAACTNGDKSLICVWDVQSGASRGVFSYHGGAVQSLSFSRDDRFFLSIGDFSDQQLALWSTDGLHLLSNVNVSEAIHDAAFSPSTASQMACVGSQGVYFGIIQTQGHGVNLKLIRQSAPVEVGDAEFTALCYHMDSFLFTSTNGGHICAWDTNMQCCIMVWEADESEIGVLLCRGTRLLTGSRTRWLRVWDIEGVQSMKSKGSAFSVEDGGAMVFVEQEIMLDGTIISAAFDHTMDMGIVGTTAGTLWYINWSDNSNIRLVSGHKTKVNDVAFSLDESHFATCSEDGSVRVWTTSSYELVVQFQVLNQACGCVCWSPALIKDQSRVAAGYSDGTLRTFRLASTEMEMKMHPHLVAVTAIQYSAHGHVIISAGKNGVIAVSSPQTGATLRVMKDHKGAKMITMQCVSEECKRFGLDGNDLWLAASADRRVSVWAADWSREKCDLLDWLSFAAPAHCSDDRLPPSLAAFFPTDHNLVVYTGYGVEKELLFYSLTRKHIIKKINLPHWATCMSLSPRSHLVALGSKERVLKLIKSTSGRFQDFVQHSDSLQSCHFSPSGKLLFSVAFNEILLWEVRGL